MSIFESESKAGMISDINKVNQLAGTIASYYTSSAGGGTNASVEANARVGFEAGKFFSVGVGGSTGASGFTSENFDQMRMGMMQKHAELMRNDSLTVEQKEEQFASYIGNIYDSANECFGASAIEMAGDNLLGRPDHNMALLTGGDQTTMTDDQMEEIYGDIFKKHNF